MTKYAINESTLSDIADAIKEKALISGEKIKVSGFAEKIRETETLGRLVIPDGAEEISDGAYAGNTTLKSVIVPRSVKRIGARAFADCTSLEFISFGGERSELYIDAQAFAGCTSLKNVILPVGTRLGNAVFSGCTGLTDVATDAFKGITDLLFEGCRSLTDIRIPSGTEIIGADAFSECTALRRVSVPSSLKSIEMNAFKYCERLECITLPSELQHIDQYALAYCTELNGIGEIGKDVSEIGTRAFYKCQSLSAIPVSEENTVYGSVNGNLYTKDRRCLMQYAAGKNDTVFYLPSEVEEICPQACAWGKMEKIILPDSIKSIGDAAFDQCTNCLIYDFTACTDVPALGSNVFTAINENARILVPLSLYDDFAVADGWKMLQGFLVRASTGLAKRARGEGAPSVWEDGGAWKTLAHATNGYCEFNGTVYSVNELYSQTGIRFYCNWDQRGYSYQLDDTDVYFTETGEYRFFIQTADGETVYEAIAEVK